MPCNRTHKQCKAGWLHGYECNTRGSNCEGYEGWLHWSWSMTTVQALHCKVLLTCRNVMSENMVAHSE